MNSYKCSNGRRVSQKTIEKKMRIAKRKLLDYQKEIYGYNFCERCKRNDCKPLDCSHHYSVANCKKDGVAELCWADTNLEILGRNCHKEKDGLNLQFSGENNN